MKKLLLLFILIPIWGLSQNSLEEVPIFPGCENKRNKRKCFDKKLRQHILTSFYYPKEAIVRKEEGRVYVQFVINSDGIISSIKARAPYKSLKEAAIKIISNLSSKKFIAGKVDGKNVNVPFTIPITFILDSQSCKL